LATLKQREIEKQTSPATLTAQLHYSDKTSFLPNNTIDAAEKSTITATITNSGKGTAFDVNLITESKYKNINFPETIPIGDIQPGESKDVTIPINADLSLASGAASFLINAREKRGYDARPVELQVPAAQLRSPELLFGSCNINDSSGLADGDGDGVPENNEIIELNPYVSNKGIGDALKISVQLTNITDGIEIIKKKDDLTSIGSGAIGKSTLAFKIPRTFAQPEIKYTVAATDVRGMRTEKTYTIPFQSKAPELYCTYRIVDTGLREISTLKNGQSCRLKIIPKNTGKNIAEGVTLRVTSASGKANIGNYDNDIGVLSPDTTGSAVTVPVSLSRSFVGQSLTLNVSMEQDGFAGFSREITLPVMTTRPELECRVVLLNGISENAVSQNSRPKFRVSLSNNGSLDAKDVKIAFKANGANITYDKENFIGTIKAGESQYKDFTFFVRGDTPVGEMPVSVRVNQADFDDLNTTVAYRLERQTALVQKVKTIGGSAGGSSITAYSGPPELYINSPNMNVTTIKEIVDLHGSVMVFGRGNAVEELTITLNGSSLKVTRVQEEIRLDPNQITRRVMEEEKTIFDGLIKLMPGVNELKIKCRDRNGQKSEKVIRITKKAKLGNIYAVVVGISNFANSEYNLDYAASDAAKFYDFLRSKAGGQLPDNQIKLLSNFSATRANVIGSLNNLLGRSTREDTVEIYLATHGYIDFNGDFYYICYDTDIENVMATGFSDRELTDVLKKINAGKVIIYLDACHSGVSGLGERYATRRDIGVYCDVNERINGLAGALSKISQTGVVTFSASSTEGYSLENQKWDGGVFTHCLINGLKGAANKNGDEWVDINEIDNYLRKKIMVLTGGKQKPKMNNRLSGETPLSKVR